MSLGKFLGIGGLVKEAGGESAINLLKIAKKSPGKVFGLASIFGGSCITFGIFIEKMRNSLFDKLLKKPKFELDLLINGEVKKSYKITRFSYIEKKNDETYIICFKPLGEEESKKIKMERNGIYDIKLRRISDGEVMEFDYETTKKYHNNYFEIKSHYIRTLPI